MMTSTDDYVEYAAIEKLRYAVKVKQVNEELLEYLTSSLNWLMRYSEKYDIPLPEKDKINLVIIRAMAIIIKLPPTKLQQPKRTPDDCNTTIFLVMFNLRVL